MGEVAARSSPDPRHQLTVALREAAAEIAAGRKDVREAIGGRGDLLELMALARRLGEFEAAVRAAALLLVAAGQPAVPEAQAPRKHRHRAPSRRSRGTLRPVPGVSPARGAAAAAVAVALSTGGLVAGMHEESAVSVVAAAPARHAALPRMVPDAATPVLRPRWSSSPRLSAAAASATPVPSVTPSPPAPAPVPVPSPTATAAPVLGVQQVLDLGASTRGVLPLSAGGDAVAWTARATDGITLSQYGGVLIPGQDMGIQVEDPTGNGGWVYVSAGSQAFAVHVTSALGSPVLALPSGL